MPQSHVMEILTPLEALTYSNLELNQTIENSEHAAVKNEIAAITAQICTRKTRLTMIRYQKSCLKTRRAILKLEALKNRINPL
jgi:hypothetical protein